MTIAPARQESRQGSLRKVRRAKITAVGTSVPPGLLTNQDLEKMVETSDEWIYSRVGIRERHLVDKGMATSDMAVVAAKRCLESRGLAATDVDAIIVATVTPDMFFPATACLVQDKLGAKGAWGFDLHSLPGPKGHAQRVHSVFQSSRRSSSSVCALRRSSWSWASASGDFRTR